MSFLASELPMMMFFVVKGIEIPVEIGSSFQDSEEGQSPNSEYKSRKTSWIEET